MIAAKLNDLEKLLGEMTAMRNELRMLLASLRQKP